MSRARRQSPLALFLAVAALLAAVTLVANAQKPGACTGACYGVSHDPAVIRRAADGTLFRFSTGGNINVATAPAIQGPWTLRGNALKSGSKINLPGHGPDLWAPDVIGPLADGFYYMLYSTSVFGKQISAIGVARSRTLDAGSWEDLGSTGVESRQGAAFNAIDGNFVQDASGNWRMTFGSFWNDLFQTDMASVTKAKQPFRPTNIALDPNGTRPVEGGFVYKHRDEYFLFFSHGVCCRLDQARPKAGEEYKIKVCKSKNVNGPFVDQQGRSCTQGGGTVLLASHDNVYAPGGQGVFSDSKSGGHILYYHYADKKRGITDGDKTFGWNVLDWHNGWPAVRSA
ncbi:hypothetical protein AMAG_00074 [Allomyces macrogynus ATCC 38327]|uniref:Arabinan endo-1,5-alpha-L-arabinosidase n=1 Tax=Allomyces macrogynus (strain ATCC 38327) TaxID=578462 RepID=A0A0L0RUL7_ALLM3|nr:hypothetical protein AMAG_00074 [Allomyces macrogynus ATCC 38327]|eukprot:KNE54072.1 hypothetical protein AMAG_00074 [Allomyces macrogynus ATCC 38327]